MLTVFDVAEYFISKVDEDTGETITHLKLQKLTYYAYAWYLTLNDGDKLFNGRYEAWAHGPVNPELFHSYKEYGYTPIPVPENFTLQVFSDDEIEFLDDIWNIYARYDAKYLEKLTHKEKPWKEARGRLPEGHSCNTPLKEETMMEYYSSLLED